VTKRALYLLSVAVGLLAIGACGYLRYTTVSSETRLILYYEDPMHPSYRSDKPGTSPDCGMALVPVYAEEKAEGLLPTDEPGMQAVSIAPATQQLYGIKLARVEMRSAQRVLRVFGRVQADETRIYRINFGTDGLVKETHEDAVGQFVSKNQHLALVYSPEFLSVAGGYLAATERTPGGATGTHFNAIPSETQGTASLQARADRLRNLGMSDVQIDEITRTRTLPEDVYVISPTDGFILSRNISQGMRFERYAPLYSIADLSHVWVEAEVYGDDAQAFRPGAIARITLPDSGVSFKATVSNVLPEVDPATRAMRPRLEADNPGYGLRPNMFVTVEFPVSIPAAPTIPEDAVLDSGLSKRVFVQTSLGKFESRAVQTGVHSEKGVQIVTGLREGEIVVASGAFLVDSESKLRLNAQSASPANVAATRKNAMNQRMN